MIRWPERVPGNSNLISLHTAAWTPAQAFTDIKACMIAMSEFGRRVPGEGNEHLVEFSRTKDGTDYNMDKGLAVKCLPDTVDPRGAKGK